MMKSIKVVSIAMLLGFSLSAFGSLESADQTAPRSEPAQAQLAWYYPVGYGWHCAYYYYGYLQSCPLNLSGPLPLNAYCSCNYPSPYGYVTIGGYVIP